jgi:hypothetical protein
MTQDLVVASLDEIECGSTRYYTPCIEVTGDNNSLFVVLGFGAVLVPGTANLEVWLIWLIVLGHLYVNITIV